MAMIQFYSVVQADGSPLFAGNGSGDWDSRLENTGRYRVLLKDGTVAPVAVVSGTDGDLLTVGSIQNNIFTVSHTGQIAAMPFFEVEVKDGNGAPVDAPFSFIAVA